MEFFDIKEDPTEHAYEQTCSTYLQCSKTLQYHLTYTLPALLHSHEFNLPEEVTDDLQSLLHAIMSLIHVIRMCKTKQMTEQGNSDEEKQVQQVIQPAQNIFIMLNDFFESNGSPLLIHYCALCNYYAVHVNDWNVHLLCDYHVNILQYSRENNLNGKYIFVSCSVCLLVIYGESAQIDSMLASESHQTFHFKMENLLLNSKCIQDTFPKVPKKWTQEKKKNGTSIPILRRTEKCKPVGDQATSPGQILEEEPKLESTKLQYSTVVLSGKKKLSNTEISKVQNHQNESEKTSNKKRNLPRNSQENKKVQEQESRTHQSEWQVVSNKKYIKRPADFKKTRMYRNSRFSRDCNKEASESMSTNVRKPIKNVIPKRKPFHAHQNFPQKPSSLDPIVSVDDGNNSRLKARKLSASKEKPSGTGKKSFDPIGSADGNHCNDSLSEAGKLSASKEKPSGTEKKSFDPIGSADSNDSLPEAGKLSASKEKPSGTEKKSFEPIGSADSNDSLPEAGKLSASKEKPSGTEKKSFDPIGSADGDDSLSEAGKLPASTQSDTNEAPTDHGKQANENELKVQKNEAPDYKQLPSKDVEKSATMDHQDENKDDVEKKKIRKRRKNKKKKNSDVIQDDGVNPDNALFTFTVDETPNGQTQFIFAFEGLLPTYAKNAEDILQKLKKLKVMSNFSFVGVCTLCEEMFDQCEWTAHLSSHQYVEMASCDKCNSSFCGDLTLKENILQHPFHIQLDDYIFINATFVFIRQEKKENFLKNGNFNFIGFCLICNLEFNKNDWDKHVESHNNSNECITCYECNTCFYGEKFDVENLLQSQLHLSIHSIAINIEDLMLNIHAFKKNKLDQDSNPPFIGLCVECAKIIESSFDWCEHLDIHKGDKCEELCCEECNTTFLGPKEVIETLYSNNENHKNIHALYS